MKLAIAVILCAMALTGCNTIRSHRNIEQPMGSILTTGIGGTVFCLNRTGALPNAFGGRDIWGGKIDKGFAEMKLAGIEGTVLTLEITEVNKHSSETTVDRYKVFQNRNTAVNVDVDNNITIGNQEQPKPYVVKFDTSKQSNIVISGVRVTFPRSSHIVYSTPWRTFSLDRGV
ncbi:MAG: hypothetical protein NTZ78_05050 [Candidatus Aureabacteria bacterium]|nr:hypothetical protein [Candidatus Auribacterota bacterium]